MKNIILSLIALFLYISLVNAQFEKPISKNHIFSGGAIKISIEKYIQTKQDGVQEATQGDKGIDLDLYTGYFVINQFAVGIKMNYNYDRSVWITNTPAYEFKGLNLKIGFQAYFDLNKKNTK